MGKSFEILEFHGLGEAWMQFNSLQQVRSVTAPLQLTPEGISQSLNNTSYDSLRQIAAGYARSGITDPEMLDVMAGFIWAQRLTDDNATADAAAHLCHALGNSGNPRYRNLLERVADEATSSALQRHARQSLKLLSGDTDAPYGPLDWQHQ